MSFSVPFDALAEILAKDPGYFERRILHETRQLEVAELKRDVRESWAEPKELTAFLSQLVPDYRGQRDQELYYQQVLARSVVDKFFTLLDAQPDLKQLFFDRAKRSDFIQAESILSTVDEFIPENKFSRTDHNRLLQCFANAYWEVHLQRIAQTDVPLIILKDLRDREGSARAAIPDYDYNADQTVLSLNKTSKLDSFKPLTLTIAGLLRKALNQLPDLGNQLALPADVRNEDSVLSQEERQHIVATEYASHFLKLLNREAVAMFVAKMKDEELRDLNSKQRSRLVSALYATYRYSRESVGIEDFTISEMEQGARIMRTCPEDKNFASLFNAASALFLQGNPIARLQNWSQLQRKEQERLVGDILNEMEAAWQKATNGSHFLFSPKNKPEVEFRSHEAYYGDHYSQYCRTRDSSDARHTFGKDWSKDSNQCIQHYQISTNAHAPTMYDYVDRQKPKGEILYVPNNDNNRFWRFIHPEDVLENLARIHLQSVRCRLLRAGLGYPRGQFTEKDPLYVVARRQGYYDYSRSDGVAADISELYYKFASPACAYHNEAQRRGQTVPAIVSDLMNHPYYTEAESFITSKTAT